MRDLSKSSVLPDMVAKCSIEYSGLIIDSDRRQYVLLTADEMQTCGITAIKYYSPKNAVLPVNMYNLCILALFFKDNNKVDKYCQKIFEPSGHWLVTAKAPLEFSIVGLASNGRKSPKTQSIQRITSFVDVISLQIGCHAANDYLNLPPYYEFEERYSLPDPLHNLLELQNKTRFRIWENFVHALPNFRDKLT